MEFVAAIIRWRYKLKSVAVTNKRSIVYVHVRWQDQQSGAQGVPGKVRMRAAGLLKGGHGHVLAAP